MSYICENCNYSTNSCSNFINHKKTKKHLKNSTIISQKTDSIVSVSNNIKKVSASIIKKTAEKIETYNCENCQANFSFKNNYYRHKKNCKNQNKNPDLEKELIETKLKLEFSEKEKQLLKKIEDEKDIIIKEKSELLNTFMSNANNIINQANNNTKVTAEAMKTVSISALKYANDKFKNTSALIPLENFNINNLDFNNEKDKAQLVEILIYHAKQKSLDKLLGDHIIKEYRKDNPADQAFHTTDCSRLNYIVRELIENALTWSVDKNGIKICTSIIKPLIKKCINALMEHQKVLLQEMTFGNFNKQKDVELIIDVLMSIDSGSLDTDINKYIAPYFNLNKKNIDIEEQI